MRSEKNNGCSALNRFRLPKFDSVVSRLRMVLLAIALLVVCTALFGSYQLYRLNQSQVLLVGESVPALVQAQKRVSLLATNLVLTNQLEVATSQEQTQRLGERLKMNIDSLTGTVAAAATNDESRVNPALLNLRNGLARLEKSTTKMIPLHHELLTVKERVSAHRAQLSDLDNQVRDITEAVTTKVASQLESALAKISSQSLIDRNQLASLISDLLESESKIKEIDFALIHTINMAQQLPLQVESELLGSIDSRMRFNLRNATQLLIRLKVPIAKRDLAVRVKELRELLSGERGLVESIREYQASDKQFEQEQKAQQEVTTMISTSIDDIVTNAQDDIHNNVVAFSKALYSTVLLLSLAALLVVVIVSVVLYFIVERQINRRMTKLTQTVLDIAEGDHERKVDIHGEDELASMANALVVFKTNARELLRSNQELEKFAYAASHDLRSPLRAIESLAEWTLEDCEGQLPKDGVDNLRKIVERTRRLSDLQTGLLEYAQIGKTEVDSDSIEVGDLVDQLADLLDPTTKYPVTVTGSLDVVVTFLPPLRQILMNLISNAIKHHDRQSGQIRIEMASRDGRLYFVFVDDGPGIEPQFHERIFGLFQTLKSRDEVEGSGLGLSLIRKQVEHYGGVISVHSDPSSIRGTTFRFDFPDHSSAPIHGKPKLERKLAVVS